MPIEKFFEREFRPDGRFIYRLAGKRVFSTRPVQVRRLAGKGRPILVVRIPREEIGLFNHFAFNLGWMRWAEDRGYRTYVDMRTPRNVFNRGKKIAFNPWDEFFQQECSAEEVFDARKVLVTSGHCTPPDFPGVFLSLCHQENLEFLAWRKFTRDHITLTDKTAGAIDARQTELFKGETRVLGCLVRGTDYTKMKPRYHPVQPDPLQVVDDARKLCAERGLKKVFLATEDRGVRDLFQREFGDDLILNQTELPDYQSDYLVDSGALGDLARTMLISTQYLVSIVLLSRCPCLLAGCASGSMGAALLSPGFEVMKFYDLGCYR